MTNVLFISETKLRQFTDLNNNVDSELIKNAIREAQDIQIQRILGTKLYNRLMDGIVANDLNANESTLLNDYICDANIYWAYYYSLESLMIRPRNNGILIANGGENSDSIDLQLYDRKRISVKNKSEWYSELLSTYLIENESLFPQLIENTKLHEKMPDYGNQLTRTPFVLRNSRGRRMDKMGIKTIDGRYPYLPQ